MGLRPRPGRLYDCGRCGTWLVFNLDRTWRVAEPEEVATECEQNQFFRTHLMPMAERQQREFLAGKSGMHTPASILAAAIDRPRKRRL